MFILLTSCFGLFDKKSDTVKLNPTGTPKMNAASTDQAGDQAADKRARVQNQIENQVVVVKVDETFKAKTTQYRVNQAELATAINNINQSTPKLLVITQVVSDNDSKDALIEAMTNSVAPVLLGGIALPGEQQYELPPIEIGDNDRYVTDVQRIAIPSRDMGAASDGVGIFELTGSSDNYNDIPLVVAKNGKLYPTLPLKIIQKTTNLIPVYYKKYLTLGEKPIKLENTGSNGGGEYTGKFRTVNYTDVINGNVNVNFADKIVILDSPVNYPYRGAQRSTGEIIANKLIEISNLVQ